MSFLRGSTNYVWCTTSVLGKGATGAVFQGVNRHSGEAVAVKTFNQMSHMRPQEVQMREFEVLKKVNHRNIVKLLAIEEEQESRGKVIVMELCTGGSLFNILDDPENSHGLEEKEFLLVLHHLAAGMKHLRDNHLVHRDLKPGNIMKFVGLDGSTIYKLTDFGAARELEDDQQFMSLYGTEEYLHPDMYERAVLRKTAGKSFGAHVDLWSIGVTLYHVATGLLPFRPHGGRRNKETMYRITTEKKPGVISGVQTSENGPIDWNRDLPATCQLSLGLKKLVTPLLGGLLEVDPERMWKFEVFFSEVTALLARKRIYVFHVNKVQSLTIYMQSDHRYEQLQWLIKEQSEVSPEHQLLLYNNTTFSKLLHCPDSSLASSFPVTSPASPVTLFSSHDEDITLTLPKTPSLKFPSFPNVVSVDQDALTGKSICSVGHAVCRMVQHHAACVALVHAAVTLFRTVLTNEVKDMVLECDRSRTATQTTSDSFTQLVTHHRRFLTTCFLACPTNQLLQTPAPPSAADATDEPESFVHLDSEGGSTTDVDHKTQLTNGVADGKPGITGLRDSLEDLVNNVVEEEKKVRVSMDSLCRLTSQLNSRLVESDLLNQNWQLQVNTINSSCHITTTPPSSLAKSKIGVAISPITAPAVSLTPASMQVSGSGCGESAVDAMAKTPAIASTLVSKLKDSWQHLLRDRAARALTFNDEQFHLLEKLKMKETAKSLECLLGCCSTTLHTSAEGLADWCKGAHVQRLQVDIAQSDLQRHGEQLQQLQARLAATQDAYHAQANRLLNALQDSSIALQGGPTAATISQSPSGAAEDSFGAPVLAADEAADIKLRSKRKHKPSHHSSSSGHRAAVVRNLERVSEKQEATLRLLEEARTLNNMVRQTVAFSQQQQQQ